jgi:hypothetical protein
VRVVPRRRRQICAATQGARARWARVRRGATRGARACAAGRPRAVRWLRRGARVHAAAPRQQPGARRKFRASSSDKHRHFEGPFRRRCAAAAAAAPPPRATTHRPERRLRPRGRHARV